MHVLVEQYNAIFLWTDIYGNIWECVLDTADCPTILISLGLSQFWLKILNANQYAIGKGKMLISTCVHQILIHEK